MVVSAQKDLNCHLISLIWTLTNAYPWHSINSVNLGIDFFFLINKSYDSIDTQTPNIPLFSDQVHLIIDSPYR